MKPISEDLSAFLFPTTGIPPTIWQADLYEFQLVNGGTLYYAAYDQDLNWNSILWPCGGQTGPYLDRTDNKAKSHFKVGLQVDNMSFDVITQGPAGPALVLGEPFLHAVHQGVFAAAQVTIWRLFMPGPTDTSPGPVKWFVGRVGEIDVSRTIATFTVNSHLELFNQNMPRNICQSSCVNTLYDASCTLSQTTFQQAGAVVLSAPSAQEIITTSLGALKYSAAPQNDDFDLGYVLFTSGVNAGISRTVKQSLYSTGTTTLSLIAPFPVLPAPGDIFTAVPGCNKQQSTCTGKFQNIANFRGMPYIPSSETAV